MHRRARVLVPALVGLLALTGCGSGGPETVDAQLVAVCMGHPDDSAGQWSYVFSRDGRTVAEGSAMPGTALTVEVPLGMIDVSGNGEPVGSLGSDLPSTVDADGHPQGLEYLSGDAACPDLAGA